VRSRNKNTLRVAPVISIFYHALKRQFIITEYFAAKFHHTQGSIISDHMSKASHADFLFFIHSLQVHPVINEVQLRYLII